jgi:hypothetical protein
MDSRCRSGNSVPIRDCPKLDSPIRALLRVADPRSKNENCLNDDAFLWTPTPMSCTMLFMCVWIRYTEIQSPTSSWVANRLNQFAWADDLGSKESSTPRFTLPGQLPDILLEPFRFEPTRACAPVGDPQFVTRFGFQRYRFPVVLRGTRKGSVQQLFSPEDRTAKSIWSETGLPPR